VAARCLSCSVVGMSLSSFKRRAGAPRPSPQIYGPIVSALISILGSKPRPQVGLASLSGRTAASCTAARTTAARTTAARTTAARTTAAGPAAETTAAETTAARTVAHIR
jgi:hypothetical protein